MDSSRSGQMNLLEEILDSLHSTTLEQGKLSAAKSLDFFRSMEDLDYKAPVGWRPPNPPPFSFFSLNRTYGLSLLGSGSIVSAESLADLECGCFLSPLCTKSI